jgi:hypothetical protein
VLSSSFLKSSYGILPTDGNNRKSATSCVVNALVSDTDLDAGVREEAQGVSRIIALEANVADRQRALLPSARARASKAASVVAVSRLRIRDNFTTTCGSGTLSR